MDLIKKNKEFVDSLDKNSKELLTKLSKGQHPNALVITCSDSRVIPEKIFNLTFGELFVIRTAGNVINDGELASLEYGIAHLNVSLIVVLAHTHCGAIHASIYGEHGEYLDPILSKIKENILTETDEEKASILNAKAVAKCIKKKFPSYKGEIVAMLYNIENGLVKCI